VKIKKDFTDGYVLAQDGEPLIAPTLSINGTSFDSLSQSYDFLITMVRCSK
jgi:hypothetical protein